MKQDKTKIRRVFSEPFKRQKVQEIEQKLTRISDISNLYGVSCGAIYKWLKQYSTTYQPTIKMVVEMESETHKTKLLRERVAELERIVGVKQIELDFLSELIKVASEQLGVDLRKDFFMKPLMGYKNAKKPTQ
jgi:transposase